MTDELKPVNCGCGGEAEIYFCGWDVHRGYYFMCGNCGIRTEMYDTEAEAITAWNLAMGARFVSDEVFDKVKTEVVEDVLKSVKIERTAKVKESWGLAVCCACEKRVFPLDKYCTNCGAKLLWEDEDNE